MVLVELNSEVAGLKVMEMYGVAEVEVVLGGGEGTGDVVVSQFNTLDDFYSLEFDISERDTGSRDISSLALASKYIAYACPAC